MRHDFLDSIRVVQLGERFGPLLFFLAISIGGCTQHRDLQYFSVVDELGNQAFYRVRIEGNTFLTDYKLQSGNFSAAAVDVIRGQMPDIPELGLDIEHERVFDEAVNQYHLKLLDQGFAMVPNASARARWLAGMERVDKARADMMQAFETIKKVDEQEKALKEAEAEVVAAEGKRDALDFEKKTQEKKAAKGTAETALGDAEKTVREKTTQKEGIEKSIADHEKKAKELKDAGKEEEAKAEQKKADDDRSNKLPPAVSELAAAKTAADQKKQSFELAGKDLENTVAAAETERELLNKAVDVAANVKKLEKRKFEEIKSQKPEAERLIAERCSQMKQHLADVASVSGVEPGAIDCTSAEAISKILDAEAKPPAPPAVTGDPDPFGSPTDAGTIDAKLVDLSRLVWYASLSKSDLVAMGQLGTNDANSFRKHVLWVSAKQVNLQDIGADIDKVISSVLAITRTSKQQAGQRSSQHEAKRNWLEQFLGKGTPVLGKEAEGLANMLFPAGAATTPTTDALSALNALRNGVVEGMRGEQ